MNKVKVRCFKGYGISGMVHNIELYLTLPGFGYAKKMYCCTNCGEIFVLDLEDPRLKGKKTIPNSLNESCPVCNSNLGESLLDYPENIVISTKSAVKIDSYSLIQDDKEGVIHDVWSLNELL